MARVQAADLGLDKFPYNGHTTTSDMFWAGLPVLTRKGTNFASRVSESLLHAVGLPELVSETTEGFFGQAVEYASQPQRIAALKQKLKTLRGSAPLFDSKRFAANLERAFAHMADRAKSGLAPDHVDIPQPDLPPLK